MNKMPEIILEIQEQAPKISQATERNCGREKRWVTTRFRCYIPPKPHPTPNPQPTPKPPREENNGKNQLKEQIIT